MKTLLSIICFIIALIVAFYLGDWTGYERGKDYLPTIEQIQERVGAVPDGILGEETQAKWERALANQFVLQFFTESGAPNNKYKALGQ